MLLWRKVTLWDGRFQVAPGFETENLGKYDARFAEQKSKSATD